MLNKKHAIFLIAMLFSVQIFAQDTPWKFIKDAGGVKVYFRDIPNKNIKDVKMTTTFNANLSTVVEAIKDVEVYPKWVYKTEISKTIKTINIHEAIYYNIIDFPWPLNDRDIAIHTKMSQNPKTKEVISISFAEPSALKMLENHVRIEHFNSKWTFKPKGDHVEAEYVFSSNPGGNIPAWMVNIGLDEGPVRTIKNFKRLLFEDKYSKANSLGIIN